MWGKRLRRILQAKFLGTPVFPDDIVYYEYVYLLMASIFARRADRIQRVHTHYMENIYIVVVKR